MAATSTLPAIVQRLHRLSDSRAPQLAQKANPDKSQTVVEESDLVRRRRNGQSKLVTSKNVAPLPVAVSFPSDGQAQSNVSTEHSSSTRLAKPAGPTRVVYFTCNNDPLGRKAKYVRITPNRYLSWNDLLNDLTAKLKHDGFYLPHGVRHIYTPTHGRRIITLDELQDGEMYLCAGVEPFKPNQQRTPDTTQQSKDSAQTQSILTPLNHPPKSVMTPALNMLSLTGSDSNVQLAQPSRYQRIGAAPASNPRPLNASVPVPARKGDGHFQRLYKRYQRLPAIKEQREGEKDGHEDTNHGAESNAKSSRPAPLDSSVAVFLRDEMRKQAGDYSELPSITKSHRAAAVYHQRKREFINAYQAVKQDDTDQPQQSQPNRLHIQSPNESRKPVPLTTEPNRLINIVYYERVSSNCKVIKILLNSPRLPPSTVESNTSDDAADAYSRYQRLYSLKRIRKILNKTFSKDESLKQKISRDAFLHLVTPSGREVTNTPDLLQILDTDTAESADEQLPKKTSVGATISDNNYMFIAMHDSPSHSSLAETSGTASETFQSLDSDRQLGSDNTTLSNNDLELILQELIAKNANKRLIHKLYQVLHYKETELTLDPFKLVPQTKLPEKQKLPLPPPPLPSTEPAKDADGLQDVTNPQTRSPAGYHLAELAVMSTKKTKSGNDESAARMPATPTVPAPAQSADQLPASNDPDKQVPDRQPSETSQKAQAAEKRVKFADGSAVDADSSSLSADSENNGAKQSRSRSRKRQVKKASSLPRFNHPEKDSGENKVRRQSDTRAPATTQAKKNAKSGELASELPKPNETDDALLESSSEAEKRLLETERKRRNQQITLVRRTMPPAAALPSSASTSQTNVAASPVAAAPAPALTPIKTAASSTESTGTPDTVDQVRRENLQSTQKTPDRRPISGPAKSMLSIDTPRDTQIDLNALKTVQDQKSPLQNDSSSNDSEDDKGNEEDEQDEEMSQQTSTTASPNIVQSKQPDKSSQTKARETPAANTARELQQKDDRRLAPAEAQPVVNATPREAQPPVPVPAQPPNKDERRENKVQAKPIPAIPVPVGKSRYSFTKFIRGMEVLQERYDFGRQLGDGNFAVVREGRSKLSGKEYAIKIIDKSKLRNKEYMLENEIRVLKTCSHPNIIELRDQYESEPNVFLIMELARGGDLFDYITSHVKFPEAQAFDIISDMAEAIFYLHSRNIVHRDLKPENLLICDGKDGRKTTKLGDFGLSMEVKKPIYTVCGTPTYVAPEILMERGYGLEVDMWALGVILYILLCGFPPFRSPDRRQSELFRMIKKGDFEFISPYWDHISSSAKDLVRHLLVVDPSKRFKAIDVLTHPWILTRGNVKRMDRTTLGELQSKKRDELEQKAAMLLKDYRDTLHQLEQQYGHQPIASFRPPA